jgi:hypothetical protein
MACVHLGPQLGNDRLEFGQQITRDQDGEQGRVAVVVDARRVGDALPRDLAHAAAVAGQHVLRRCRFDLAE